MIWFIIICSVYIYISAYWAGRTIADNDSWIDVVMAAFTTLFWLPIFLFLCGIWLIASIPSKKPASHDNNNQLQNEGDML